MASPQTHFAKPSRRGKNHCYLLLWVIVFQSPGWCRVHAITTADDSFTILPDILYVCLVVLMYVSMYVCIYVCMYVPKAHTNAGRFLWHAHHYRPIPQSPAPEKLAVALI